MMFLHGFEKSRSSRLRAAVSLVACLLFAAAVYAQTDVVQTLTEGRAPVPPATGTVQESFIATTTPAPVAVVIFLPGSTGDIKLTPDGLGGGTVDVTSTNGRNRWLYAGHNLYAITLDAATDFLQFPKGLTGYEGSAAHVTDILAVISWARSTLPGVPVWIVGISRGTGGAFVAGQYSPALGGPDGLVLASSINDTTDADSVLMANLAGITVPVLLINDNGNTCTGTQASGEVAVRKALKLSPRVGVELLPAAGLTALTSNCLGLSDHAFFGDEDLLVKDVALWIGSTQTILTTSGNPTAFGSPVTFTATVSYLARLGTATGTVRFRDETTATTLSSSPLVSGVATLTTSTLSAGKHSIVASYGGDATSMASSSIVLVQQID